MFLKHPPDTQSCNLLDGLLLQNKFTDCLNVVALLAVFESGGNANPVVLCVTKRMKDLTTLFVLSMLFFPTGGGALSTSSSLLSSEGDEG